MSRGKSRSKSSQRWLNEHHSDDYVRKSKEQSWRSRAVFKLLEIDERDRLIKPDMCVVELGAAPGGWTQYVARKLSPNGYLLAVDILAMDAVEDACILQADFTEDHALEQIREMLDGRAADLVLSDMAPNFTGQSAVDQPRSIYLAELALDMCEEFLAPGGNLLIKAFQGAGIEELTKNIRGKFASCKSRKPSASRPRSREIYLLAVNKR
ncbi:23S rRNA methyltransferase [Chromatiales bacterium (ex Bugula neritina AB1)]|nr:23S rRNA methyltransferase [Chromatiales bacterium (ex Bugula neritina AB1)]